jgi:NitT/TauT family transport system ATP-binding protein
MDKNHQLVVTNIVKEFYSEETTTRVLDGVSLEVFTNEFVVILGPGRSGKTTLLNIIAGILKQTKGEIQFPSTGDGKERPEIGMVYQRIALMPWLTVMKNVEFLMKLKGIPESERKPIAQHYIDMVKLDGFEDLLPHQLSGGMKQRVGIARAYSIKPDLLLMDEPYGQLDAQTRYSMQEEIIRIHNQDRTAIVFVTSNLEEALMLGDRIVVLSAPPSKVKGVYDVELPHPRDMMDTDFMQLRQEISDNMDRTI